MQLKDEVKLMRRQMSMNTETKKEQEATVEDATDATDEDEDEFTWFIHWRWRLFTWIHSLKMKTIHMDSFIEDEDYSHDSFSKDKSTMLGVRVLGTML